MQALIPVKLPGPMFVPITDKSLGSRLFSFKTSLIVEIKKAEWYLLSWFVKNYENLQEFLEKHKDDELFFLSTKSKQNHTEIKYPEDAYLLFGKESKGLPEWLLLDNMDRCVRIPMRENIRSLNLSNSVAIAAYEYYRQRDFKDLQSVSPYFE